MPGISSFRCCFKVLVWKVWLKYKVPLQYLLFFYEQNSKQQYKNRHNKLSKEKAEEEQGLFSLKYCYALWLTPGQILSNLFSYSFIINLRKEWVAEKILTWSPNLWSMHSCRIFFFWLFLGSSALLIFLAPLLTAVFHSVHHWGSVFWKGKKQQQVEKAEAISQTCLGPPAV